MYHIKYLLLTFVLMSFVACNSTKEPKEIKEIVTEKNTTKVPTLGNLSKKQKIVKKELLIYLKKLSTFNTDAIVDMTYPKLFNVIDPDLFRQYIASMMNSTDIEMLLYKTNITKLSKVTTFSNKSEFAQATYLSTIKLHFLNSNLYNTEEKMNFLYDAFSHKYGTENIHISKKERTIQIKEFKKVLIIKEGEENSEWKFLGADPRYRKLFPNFLPLEFQIILK